MNTAFTRFRRRVNHSPRGTEERYHLQARPYHLRLQRFRRLLTISAVPFLSHQFIEALFSQSQLFSAERSWVSTTTPHPLLYRQARVVSIISAFIRVTYSSSSLTWDRLRHRLSEKILTSRKKQLYP